MRFYEAHIVGCECQCWQCGEYCDACQAVNPNAPNPSHPVELGSYPPTVLLEEGRDNILPIQVVRTGRIFVKRVGWYERVE